MEYIFLGIEVTEEQSNALVKALEEGKELKVVDGKVVAVKHEPTEKELAEQRIAELKQLLAKYKEDVEQVELFGMERTDYEEKKRLCAEMILELRELEKKNAV